MAFAHRALHTRRVGALNLGVARQTARAVEAVTEVYHALELSDTREVTSKVRTTSRWPSSWANISRLSLYSDRNAWPTCSFWANRTSFSLKRNELRELMACADIGFLRERLLSTPVRPQSGGLETPAAAGPLLTFGSTL
jgi:hypothetical protein